MPKSSSVSNARWKLTCDPDESVAYDAGDALAESAPRDESPIDEYYRTQGELLVLGTPDAIEASEQLGRALLLALVSGVEHYVRRILGEVVSICPVSREIAGAQEVLLRDVDHYGMASVGHALFDTAIFSTQSSIEKTVKRTCGIELKDDSVRSALDQFYDICELRHAAVHSVGHLGAKNQRRLRTALSSPRVHVDFAALQSIARAGTAVVRSLNRVLFVSIIERWIGRGLFEGSWSEDKSSYQPIFTLFHSKSDGEGPTNAYQSYRSLQTHLP